MTRVGTQSDWSRSPAAGFAAVVLGVASVGGIGWSVFSHDPVPVAPAPLTMLGGAASDEPSLVVHMVDINSASGPELELLPGVGPVTAAEILRDREKNGPFAAIEDLDRVHGIGPKTIAGLRDRAVIGRD